MNVSIGSCLSKKPAGSSVGWQKAHNLRGAALANAAPQAITRRHVTARWAMLAAAGGVAAAATAATGAIASSRKPFGKIKTSHPERLVAPL